MKLSLMIPLPKDKVQHFAIGAVVALVASLLSGWVIGLMAGIGISILIEVWQWTGNRLMEWKPALFGRWLKVRCPDLMDALAGSLGAMVGAFVGTI